MSYIEVVLPQMGEGVIEATITRWFVEVNSKISADEPLLEIATDKVDSEIPSPVNGILIKKFFAEGEIPKVGDVIAIVQSENGQEGAVAEILTSEIKNYQETKPVDFNPQSSSINKQSIQNNQPSLNKSHKASPFITHYAGQRGISVDELENVTGTGARGEITKTDVDNYFRTRRYKVAHSPVEATFFVNKTAITPAGYEPRDGEEIIEIDRTRKIIAERMQQSLQTAPHVTSFIDADVTPLVLWREQNKKKFLEQNKIGLTYTPVIAEIVVKALKEFPDINVSFVNDKIIRKKYINIGIATALPNGNLVVPVVKEADKLNLLKLALDIHDLATRARNGNLAPGETQGGTFTITNLGQFNTTTGTPIINQPESAILAVGAIKKKPGVVDVNGLHTIGIRDIVTLALSYDHRIVDGALGGAFLSRIAYLLENSLPVL
jgi:2-oxoglutarate dehydrogenase E2 component (dihydrolipoamide succinyltransferase)